MFMDLLLGQFIPLPFESLRIFIALAGTAVGTYYDLWNNKNIPNWLLYGFMLAAFVVNIAAYDGVLTTYAILIAAVIFGIAYLLYRAGQLGGADAFIMASIALLLPVQPQSLLLAQNTSALPELPFAFYMVVASGLSFMAYMLFRSFPIALLSIRTKGAIPSGAWASSAVIIVAYAIFANFASGSGFFSQSYFAFVSLVVALIVYFTLFKDALNRSMVQTLPPGKVEEEDIIAVDQLPPAAVKKYSLSRLVDSGMLLRLRKSGIKKVPVYSGLPPFIPHILIGLVLSLLFGNVVLMLAGQPFM